MTRRPPSRQSTTRAFVSGTRGSPITTSRARRTVATRWPRWSAPFRDRGLRVGFYHSLLDWHHPDYMLDPVQGHYRDHPDRKRMNRGRDQQRYARELIRTLIDCVSKGGNLLLNVGPTARGEFDERSFARLRGIGEWMRRHVRTIYDCTQAPEGFVAPPDTRFTCDPDARQL